MSNYTLYQKFIFKRKKLVNIHPHIFELLFLVKAAEK